MIFCFVLTCAVGVQGAGDRGATDRVHKLCPPQAINKRCGCSAGFSASPTVSTSAAGNFLGKCAVWGRNLLGFGWFWGHFWCELRKATFAYSYLQKPFLLRFGKRIPSTRRTGTAAPVACQRARPTTLRAEPSQLEAHRMPETSRRSPAVGACGTWSAPLLDTQNLLWGQLQGRCNPLRRRRRRRLQDHRSSQAAPGWCRPRRAVLYQPRGSAGRPPASTRAASEKGSSGFGACSFPQIGRVWRRARRGPAGRPKASTRSSAEQRSPTTRAALQLTRGV